LQAAQAQAQTKACKREWQPNRTTTDIRRTEQNNEDKAFKKLAAHCTL